MPDMKVFNISSEGKDIPCERRGLEKPSLIFTHGANRGLSSAAAKEFADGFAEVLPVVSFEGTDGKDLPARIRGFHAVLGHENIKCALGGRSIGARAAAMAAILPGTNMKNLVLVSYPMFGSKDGESREQHLLDLPDDIDVLFISGTKDSMLAPYGLDKLREVMKKMKGRTWLVEVKNASHGMTLDPEEGTEAMIKHTGTLAGNWLRERTYDLRFCSLSWDQENEDVATTGWVALE